MLQVSDQLSINIGPNLLRPEGWIRQAVIPWLTTFSAIVKVSDSPEHLYQALEVPTFWIPISELEPVNMLSLYTFKHTMDTFLHKSMTEPQKIYLHCEAGVSRSQLMAYLWLQSLEPPFNIEFPSGEIAYKEFKRKGYIPQGALELLSAITHDHCSEYLAILMKIGKLPT